MGKALVIVESPAKAKTINKYLGSDYVVKSSVGHIRDLPTSGSAAKKSADSTSTKTAKKPKKDERGALVNRMGVDPWHNWEAHYEVLPGKEKVVSELKQLAEKADHIYLATDLDREGEAIAWHLREVIGGDDARYNASPHPLQSQYGHSPIPYFCCANSASNGQRFNAAANCSRWEISA